jgi:plastocyanin
MSLGALLAACGDDDDEDGGNAGTTASPSVSRNLTPLPTTAASPSAGASPGMGASPQTEASPQTGASPAAGNASGAGDHLVEMTDDLVFEPEELTLRVGETVTWRTTGTQPHSATCDPAKAANQDDAQLPEGAEPWDSGIITQGQEWSHTFETPGEYVYFCIPHEVMGMIGRLMVEEA